MASAGGFALRRSALRAGAAARCPSPASARRASSSSAGPSPPLSERVAALIARARALAPASVAAAGGIVVVYGTWRILVSVTESVMSLSFFNVFEYGFVAGAGTVLAVAGAAAYGARLTRISPDAACRAALALVLEAPAAERALGTNIREGPLKAFVAAPAHLTARGGLAWVEPRIQVLFQVVGEFGEAMVTAEAIKHRGALIWTVVALDVLATAARPAQTIVLRGSEDKLHVRGTLRGLLQQKVAFVPQDREVSEDDLLREQRALDEAAAAAAAAAKQPLK